MRHLFGSIGFGVVVVALLLSGSLTEEAVHAQGDITVSILCSQYLREQPSDSSARVGLMNPGERHQALGRYGWWVYLQVSDTLRGWSYDGICLRVRGDFEQLPVLDPSSPPPLVYAGTPQLEVQCTQYLRTQPALESTRVMIMQPAGGNWPVRGRSADSYWLYVASPDGSQAGWTALTDCVSLRGNLSSLPVVSGEVAVSVYSGAPVVRATCPQNLRVEPSLDGQRVGAILPADGALKILGRSADALWAYVQTPAGLRGWTHTGECVTVLGDLLTVPIQAANASSGAPVAMIACAQNLRAQPALTSPALRILQPADGPLPVEATTENAGWVYLILPDGTRGWTVNAACVSVLGRPWDAPEYVDDLIPEDALVLLPADTTPFVNVACSQYLRNMPSLDAARIAIMNPGDGPYTVTGRTEDRNWLYLSNQQRQGWAARGNCLSVQGNVTSVPLRAVPAVEPSGLLVCDQYLRAEPRLDAPALEALFVGTRLTIQGRNASGGWVLAATSDGLTGWMSLGNCLSVEGDIFSKPVVNPAQPARDPLVASLTCTQYLRAAPLSDAGVLKILDGSEGALRVTGRDANSAWLQIRLESGVVGWAVVEQ
jgi:hypothetical protein